MRLIIFILLVCGSLQAQISRSILQDSIQNITIVQDSVTKDWVCTLTFWDGIHIIPEDTVYVPQQPDTTIIDTVIIPAKIDTIYSQFVKTFQYKINMRGWLQDLRNEFDGEIGAANIRIEKYLFDRNEAAAGLSQAREDKRKAQGRRSSVNDLISTALARPASTILPPEKKKAKKKKSKFRKWLHR